MGCCASVDAENDFEVVSSGRARGPGGLHAWMTARHANPLVAAGGNSWWYWWLVARGVCGCCVIVATQDHSAASHGAGCSPIELPLSAVAVAACRLGAMRRPAPAATEREHAACSRQNPLDPSPTDWSCRVVTTGECSDTGECCNTPRPARWPQPGNPRCDGPLVGRHRPVSQPRPGSHANWRARQLASQRSDRCVARRAQRARHSSIEQWTTPRCLRGAEWL